MGWMDDAVEEIDALGARLVERHEWAPSMSKTNEHVDLFITMRRNPDTRYALRLRYAPDWQVAGRREEFVNPQDYSDAGTQWWPNGVNAVKSTHRPPAICLVGYWGFHSVLHQSDGRTPGTHSLRRVLRDLQTEIMHAG